MSGNNRELITGVSADCSGALIRLIVSWAENQKPESAGNTLVLVLESFDSFLLNQYLLNLQE